MYVIVKLRERAESGVLDELEALAGRSTAITPLAPGATVELGLYFAIRIENVDEGQRLASRLMQSPSVETAYVKPEDEPP